jgi:hypothetical protein
MKNRSTSNSARAINSRGNSLKSLLTLASGAASLGALAPAAEAAIYYTAFNATVGFGVGQLAASNIDLPGTASLQLAAFSGDSHRVVAAQTNGFVRVARQYNIRSGGTSVAFRTNAGANWDAPYVIKGSSTYFGNIIRSALGNLAGPGVFSTKYLLFKFTNTADGNQEQYGWVGMSGATYTAGTPSSMSVTFTGWAYEDSGAMINAGAGITAVPEVSTGVVSALLAAMVVGGAELRRWRKSKPANVSQPG